MQILAHVTLRPGTREISLLPCGEEASCIRDKYNQTLFSKEVETRQNYFK